MECAAAPAEGSSPPSSMESATMDPIQYAKETTPVDLGELLDACEDAVVTLVAGDTHLVAHRAVLMDRSPVFAAMFEHDTLEKSSGQVAIADVEGPVLRRLLSYLYTLRAPPLSDTAPQLLAAASKYGVAGLKAACEQQLVAQLSVETAAAAAVLAIRHSCDSLRKAAVTFIKANFVHVVGTQGWADAVRLQPEDVVEVSRLLADPPAETSTPAPADSGTSRQPHSDDSRHSGTPASAAPASHTPAPDDATVSSLRSLDAMEKVRRLMKAAAEGEMEDLEALLAAGVDVSATDKRGNTALHWAACGGKVEAARLLLRAGAAVDAPCDRQETFPLHLAAERGHVALVHLLLDASADHSARGWDGWTALHWAARAGRVEVARLLVERGAAVDPRSSQQQHTPLYLAAASGHTATVQLLLAASADYSARDWRGWTPLHWVALKGHADVASALLVAGADRRARNNDGKTPLDLARQEGMLHLVKLLG